MTFSQKGAIWGTRWKWRRNRVRGIHTYQCTRENGKKSLQFALAEVTSIHNIYKNILVMSHQACTSCFDQLHLKLNISKRPNSERSELGWVKLPISGQLLYAEGREYAVLNWPVKVHFLSSCAITVWHLDFNFRPMYIATKKFLNRI